MSYRRLALIAALSPSLALVACGDGRKGDDIVVTNDGNVIPNETLENVAFVNDGEMPLNESEAIANAPPMTPQQFANAMAASDAYEIAAGRLAEEKATAPALRQFGAAMVRAHTDASAKLNTAAGSTTPDAALSPSQSNNLNLLRSASGEAFDTAYRTQQIAAHQQAMSMLQVESQKGQDPNLRQFAATTLPVVQGHLAQIQGM